MSAADVRAAGARRLIVAEWHAREAAARGLSVDPTTLAAAEAADARRGPCEETREETLKRMNMTVEQRRAEIADGLLSEAIDDDVLRRSGADPVAFGRAFDALARRRLAKTRCAASVVGEAYGACGNVVPKLGRCVAMGPDEVCPIRSGRTRTWYVPGDLIMAFTDPARLDAVDNDTVVAGISRVRRFLAAHGSDAMRRCDDDPDDVAYFDCRRRADAVAVLWAIARIHAAAKRRWSVPATHGVLS